MEILKRFAVPLEDTPDSVLRRILQEYVEIKSRENGQNGEKARMVQSGVPYEKDRPRGKSKQRYAQWIIASLKSKGGRARARDVISYIGRVFNHEITESERETLKSGKPRWIKGVNAARVELIKRGLLTKTKYGIWELSGNNNNSNKLRMKSGHD